MKSDYERFKDLYDSVGIKYEIKCSWIKDDFYEGGAWLREKGEERVAMVWEASTKYTIGYISHAIEFKRTGEFIRLTNWDY